LTAEETDKPLLELRDLQVPFDTDEGTTTHNHESVVSVEAG